MKGSHYPIPQAAWDRFTDLQSEEQDIKKSWAGQIGTFNSKALDSI
jgi:hypothetical protein